MLSLDEKQKLLCIARQVIVREVGGGDEVLCDDPALQVPCGVFVTLMKDGELRGCIGNPHATMSLVGQVARAAEGAALRDPRFSAVVLEEVDAIEIEVSVLSPMSELRSSSDIEIGRHGLYVKRELWSGLLLPKVAERFAWDGETFLNQVCRKAGLAEDAWREDDTQVWTFEAEVFGED
jgi:AmmeMemoRadiSam system protein A